MTTVQMECFIEAAHCLNFTTAAEHLYMTQPALSKQILNLERQLETKLLVREKKTVVLTPTGQALYHDMMELYQDYTRMLAHVRQMKQGSYGQLEIALMEDQKLNEEIIRAVNQLLILYPQVKINLSHMELKEIHTALINNRIDFAIELRHFEPYSIQIDSLTIENEPEYLIVPSSLDLESLEIHGYEDYYKIAQQVPLLALDEENFEVPTRSSLSSIIESRQSHFAQFHQIRYVTSLGAIPLYVVAGLGATMGNYSHMLRDDPHAVFLQGNPERKIEKSILWNKENQNPLLPVLLKQLKKELNYPEP